MHTRGESRNGGLQAAVHEVADHARSLARLEVELASLELRSKASALAGGGALVAAGLVLGVFAAGFLLATAAAALALVLPTWLALLAVGGGLLVAALLAVALGRSQLRRGVPPVPRQALVEAKLTGEALKGRHDG